MRLVGVFVLVVALLVSACTSENRVRSKLDNVDQDQLRSEMAALRGAPREVPEEEWPVSVQEFDPKIVSVKEEGVYLQVYRYHVAEDGLFYLFGDTGFKPEESVDPRYEQIDGALYYFNVAG